MITDSFFRLQWLEKKDEKNNFFNFADEKIMKFHCFYDSCFRCVIIMLNWVKKNNQNLWKIEKKIIIIWIVINFFTSIEKFNILYWIWRNIIENIWTIFSIILSGNEELFKEINHIIDKSNDYFVKNVTFSKIECFSQKVNFFLLLWSD